MFFSVWCMCVVCVMCSVWVLGVCVCVEGERDQKSLGESTCLIPESQFRQSVRWATRAVSQSKYTGLRTMEAKGGTLSLRPKAQLPGGCRWESWSPDIQERRTEGRLWMREQEFACLCSPLVPAT